MNSDMCQEIIKPSSSLTVAGRSSSISKSFSNAGYFASYRRKSGSLESTMMVDYRQHGFCEILPKPITLPTLAEKRKSVLAGKTC